MVTTVDSALEGMQKATQKMAKAADSVAKMSDPDHEDTLPKDIVDIKVAKHAYAANIAVLKTHHEMQKDLIDILA